MNDDIGTSRPTPDERQRRRLRVGILSVLAALVIASCGDGSSVRTASYGEAQSLYRSLASQLVGSELNFQINDQNSGVGETGDLNVDFCGRPPRRIAVEPSIRVEGSLDDVEGVVFVGIGFASRDVVKSYMEDTTSYARTCAADLDQGFRPPGLPPDLPMTVQFLSFEDERLQGALLGADIEDQNISGVLMVRGLDTLVLQVGVSAPAGFDSAAMLAKIYELVIAELESFAILS